MNRHDVSTARPTRRRRPRRATRTSALGRHRLRLVAGLVLVYLFVPIAVIVLFSFNKPSASST